MAPTPRAALLLALVALTALVLPVPLPVVAGLAVLAATVFDALAVRRPGSVERRVVPVLSRGVSAAFSIRGEKRGARTLRLRQPTPPDLTLGDAEGDFALDTSLLPRRRGRHELPRIAIRAEGPLGLGAWYHRAGEVSELLVYPDLPSARRIALAVRRGRFGGPGRLSRGPLGMGTDFESIRDYLPDDDIRQVNWKATGRLGRPMSNQFRIEQDREVMCVVDAGRLMAAPIDERTRLDAAIDAVTAVGLVTDELGDRVGTIAFDTEIRRSQRPRRRGGEAVVRALFDVEPTPVDSDYELAFRAVGGAKRALVFVFTDLLEESAARPLVEAVPVIARRHAVVVASVADPDLEALVETAPSAPYDAYAAAVAVDVLAARARAAALVHAAGAQVVEAAPDRFSAACVQAYLKAKARARL